MNENKLWLILTSILIITTIIDVWTAQTPIFHIAEANPIYVIFKNSILLATITILLTILIIYWLKKSISLPKIFIVVMGVIYLAGGHLLGAYSNISTWNNFQNNYNYQDISEVAPIDKEKVLLQNIKAIEKFSNDYSSVLPDKQKIKYYSWIIGIIVILPFLLSYMAFIITLHFYEERKPIREKITDQIYNLSKKLLIK